MSPLAAAYARTVFYFEDVRSKFFSVCSPDGGREFNYHRIHVTGTFAALRNEYPCKDCWDLAFADEVKRMMLLSLQKGFEMLCGGLSHMRIGSGIVVRKHLHGQSLKPVKRGLAVAATQLSVQTYRKTVIERG